MKIYLFSDKIWWCFNCNLFILFDFELIIYICKMNELLKELIDEWLLVYYKFLYFFKYVGICKIYFWFFFFL